MPFKPEGLGHYFKGLAGDMVGKPCYLEPIDLKEEVVVVEQRPPIRSIKDLKVRISEKWRWLKREAAEELMLFTMVIMMCFGA